MPTPLWEKGQPSPNPAGRPVGSKSFTTKVKEALEKIAEGKDYTYEEAFIKSILKKAIVDGDSTIQRLIWNYLDGMPAQKMDISGNLILNIEKEVNDKYVNKNPENSIEGQPPVQSVEMREEVGKDNTGSERNQGSGC